jgi:hypothetical protein
MAEKKRACHLVFLVVGSAMHAPLVGGSAVHQRRMNAIVSLCDTVEVVSTVHRDPGQSKGAIVLRTMNERSAP